MKRFFKTCHVQVYQTGGFEIFLDANLLQTTAKRQLVLPTRALAEQMAQEWGSQGEEIEPQSMPMTGYAFTALDVVADKEEQIRKETARYAQTDLLCYIPKEPAELNARLLAAWPPILDWSEQTLKAPLTVTNGLMAIAQPAQSVSAIEAYVKALNLWQLTAVQTLTSVLGSIVLALAVKEQRLSADDAFALARIEEDFQAEQWGQDEEADKKLAQDRTEVRNAARFLQMTKIIE